MGLWVALCASETTRIYTAVVVYVAHHEELVHHVPPPPPPPAFGFAVTDIHHSAGSFSVNLTVERDAMVYVAAVLKDAAAPSAAEMQAGSGVTIEGVASLAGATANSPYAPMIMSLTGGIVNYDVYLYAVSTGGDIIGVVKLGTTTAGT